MTITDIPAQKVRITQPLLKTIVELDDGECKPKPGYSPKEPTMSNPNFVSDLVAMAKAFEELPIVQEALRGSEYQRSQQSEVIQRLEGRIMELKAELDTTHATVRKVEVERDHAERMFLETDDRLNAFRRLVQAFDTDVKSLVQAAEPEPEVQVATSPVQGHEPIRAEIGDPGPAIGGAFEGQGDVDPTVSTDSTSASPNVSTQPVETQTTASSDTEAVSVQPDPTQATETSSESGLSGSNVNEGQREVPLGTEVHTGHSHSEVAAPADPTASSTAGDGHSSGNVEATSPVSTQADATSDDVGYHNEPKIGPAGGPEAWHDWDNWCSRMNRKYGGGSWPARPTLHGDREAAAQ